MILIHAGMVDELSDEAIDVAYELAQSPTVEGLWKEDFAASWGELDEDVESRDRITIFKVAGTDTSPKAGHATLHSRRLDVLSVKELKERYESVQSAGKTAADT